MSWKTKLVVDSAKALIPFQDRIRHLKRRFSPYSFDGAIDQDTLNQGLEQIAMLKRAKVDLTDKVVLEIGSGWQPYIPLLYRIAGVRQVMLTDTQQLMDKHCVLNALSTLKAADDDIKAALGQSASEFAAAAGELDDLTFDQVLERLGLRYLAPCDTQKLDLADNSVDILTSRAVLEHIPPQVLENILREGKRILGADGHMCHIVDNSDHWEHNDKSITRINFLRFDERAWRMMCINPLSYQNRLRHYEYLELFERNGYRILSEDKTVCQEAIAALPNMKLAAPYRDVDPQQLAAITSYIVAAA